MHYGIRRARQGDEAHLAYIQTESWKRAFQNILNKDVLERSTNIDKVTAMYQRVLMAGKGNGYLLSVDGKPHCIAWWDQARDEDMPDYAELICIHSLQDKWGKGYGTKMMNRILADMKDAGYGKAMLWVFAENHRARMFYEARGFVTYGKVKPCFDAQEICYEKDL